MFDFLDKIHRSVFSGHTNEPQLIKPLVIDICSPPVSYNGKIIAFSELWQLTLDGSSVIIENSVKMRQVEMFDLPESINVTHLFEKKKAPKNVFKKKINHLGPDEN